VILFLPLSRQKIVTRLPTAGCRLCLWTLAPWVGIGLSGLATAATQPSTAWLSGAALQKQLAEPVDVFWSGTPLRQALGSLSHSQRVAVLVDRRTDPGQALQIKRNGLSLDRVFLEIAQNRGLGLCWVGPVAYLGPARATARARTLVALRREEVGRLPPAAGRKFLLPKRTRWDDFATPRDLLSQCAAQSGIEIAGLELVPHDLWAGADLPPLSLIERLTLIAGQFDLTFQIAADARAVALIPIPDDVMIVRTYPGGGKPEQLADRYRALVPESQVEVVAGKVRVRGLLEDHERITGSRRTARPEPAQPAGDAPGEKQYTVRDAKGQLGPMLEQLAEKLGLELRIDPEALLQAGISLQQPVAFSVEKATLDELFEAIVVQAGCTARRQGNVIEIRPE
jgi:hypothetical protein